MREKNLNPETAEAVYIYTHTLGIVRKKRKIGENSQSKTAVAGITLVALVVTIIVLLILAGITIMYTMGDNSIFKRASDAKLKTDIAKYQEMLETSKGPVIIDGLGTFNPDAYFEYIQKQGIIEDKDIDVMNNEDGTYDVTTKPGYIFLVELMPTKEKPTDAEITYLGQAGKIAPIIKRIETSSTQTSITAKVIVVRLGNGTVTYYYKLADAEDSSYQEITNIDTETGATQDTGITAGEKYIVKVVAKNEAGEVSDTIEITATKVLAESMALNKTKAIVVQGKTLTLTAEVKPDDTTNKTIKWTSSNEAIATVSETGVVTGKTNGTVTITAKTTDGSEIEATCNINVMDENTATWEEINEMAKEIANDSSITNSSSQATVIVNGESKTISVGGIYKVKYSGTEVRVRVLGFKHDDLVNTGVYGGSHTKASISLEFLDFMTGSNYMSVHNTFPCSGGWANAKLRKDLNGYTTNSATQGGAIGGLGANLSNKAYIKQVKKKYISSNKSASSVKTCNDYLWLLADSELVSSRDASGKTVWGGAIASEGDQYKFYQGKGASDLIKKTSASGKAYEWWVRSPWYNNNDYWCKVSDFGGTSSNYIQPSYNYGIAPGFCI